MMALKVRNDLEDILPLRKILKDAVEKSKATILGNIEHKFEPHGYSLVLLISESHASLHTYPEENSLFIDFFTCGDITTKVFKEHILTSFDVQEVIELVEFERGRK